LAVRRTFVPWLAGADALAEAFRSVPAECRAGIRPRIVGRTVAPGVVEELARLCGAVYMDGARHGEPATNAVQAVPIYALNTSSARLRRARLVDGPERVAVRVWLECFADEPALADELRRFCAATSTPPGAAAVFVDLPVAGRPVSVVAAVAAGVTRRLARLAPWGRIVVGLDGLVDPLPRPGSIARPPLIELTGRSDLDDVSLAERAPALDGVAIYPTAGRWFTARPNTRDAGLLAELVASHREFEGDACCAGDAWLGSAVASGSAGDSARWRWAALVHWLTSTARTMAVGEATTSLAG
jgi:hypothetical protein